MYTPSCGSGVKLSFDMCILYVILYFLKSVCDIVNQDSFIKWTIFTIFFMSYENVSLVQLQTAKAQISCISISDQNLHGLLIKIGGFY